MLLHLYAALAHASESEGADFTLYAIWDHSGPLAKFVIILLAAMMIAAIVVSIERLIAFNRGRSQSMQLAAAIVGPMQKSDIEGALKVARDEKFKSAYLGGILRAGLGELVQRFDAHGVTNSKRAVDKAIGEELAKTRRGMTILATVGSTAPFVGLFGTTFGVINAFQGMATGGSGLSSISAGISEALITTGVGIGVAVVGVWMFNYFNSRIEKIQEELSASEADFLDWAEKLMLDRTERAAGK